MRYREVARFIDLTQAQAARSALEGSGIPANLRDEQMGSLNWFNLPALGGLRLEVPEDRADDAIAILGLDTVAEEPGYHELLGRPVWRSKRFVAGVTLSLLLVPYIIRLAVNVVTRLR